MRMEQESRVLQQFVGEAERREIATAEHIQQAFEAEVKHEVHITSIYRLLDRHGWRKLVPRPRHPKANAQEQDAFQKKLQASCPPGAQPTPSYRLPHLAAHDSGSQ